MAPDSLDSVADTPVYPLSLIVRLALGVAAVGLNEASDEIPGAYVLCKGSNLFTRVGNSFERLEAQREISV